jgi:hypothetical protein
MANAGLLLGWNRSVPGYEAQTVAKFGEFIGYLTVLVMEKKIESFEPVITRPHGGDLNGFFLIRGERAQLNALQDSDGWKDWEVWGAYHLQGFGVVECNLGAEIAETMKRFGKLAAS